LVVLRQRIRHLLIELDAAEDGADSAAAADRMPLLRFFLIEHAAIERELGALVVDMHSDRRVELAQDLFVGGETKRAEENASEELALAVDADVEDVLLVVLELHQGAAVRK